jgi:hypothetical protein
LNIPIIAEEMVNPTFKGEIAMKVGIGFVVSAAAAASLSFGSAAFGQGVAKPFPANAITFSAQTVAAAPANQVIVPSGAITYQQSGILAGGVGFIDFFAPPGAAFAAPPVLKFNPSCTSFPTAVGVLMPNGATANGRVRYTTPAAAANCNFPPQPFATASGTGTTVELGPATLTNVPDLSVPGNELVITAQGFEGTADPSLSDATPIPVLTLRSVNTFEFADAPLSPPLTINLAGTAGSTPGTQFDNGAGGISPAGFLGTIRAHARQDIDAKTGQPLTAPPTGTLSATVSGNFFSITQAYLTVNPANPRASCVSPAPGTGAGVINATNSAITFTPPLPTAFPNSATTWAVCIISGATIGGAPVQIPTTPVTLDAATNVATTSFVVADNVDFGRIAANGSAAYFQNVFGAANGYPTFFRVANPTSVAAPVFAILTRDGIATQFNGTLTAVPGNNAMFFSADTVAGAAGTTLVAGSLHATVRLLSPTASVLFSAISQNATTLDLSALP